MLRLLRSGGRTLTSSSSPAQSLLPSTLVRGQSRAAQKLWPSRKWISNFPPAQGLYSPKLEKDSCGVGLVAHLKKHASRQIVVDANEMLVRMSHRGGCGCEPNTGDGAGMLVAIPDSFMRKVAKKEFGKDLPPVGQYAVGNIFTSKNDTSVQEAKDVLTRIVKQRGFKLLGFRMVPTDNKELGASALATEPYILQVFVDNNKGMEPRDFGRELFRIRKLVESEAELSPHLKDFYVVSLSNETITYKGQLTPEQLYGYYGDLSDPDFTSHMALVHSRFSTNTFPSWDRAQPIRMMCHNGEINTLRGNKNMMAARSGLMESPYFKTETHQLLPVTSDKMSDSGNFDSCLETLVKASNRSIPETIMMMVPEAWQDNQYLSDTKKAFYEYNSCIMEPWDGPAMIAFTDGRYIGATLDRNGLRPSRYYVTHDDRVLLSSEVGVLSELPDDIVKTKARLEPGKMFLVDFEKGDIIPDSVIKEEIAQSKDYGNWVQQRLMNLDNWSKSAGGKYKLPSYNMEQSNRRFNMFGYTTETMDMLLYPMAVGGKEALGSMGNDIPLAVLSNQPRPVFDYFKQLFAQVTNPPIDPIREEMVMSLVCPVGPEGNLLTVGPEHAERLVVDHPVLTLEQMQAVKDTEFRGWKSRTIDITFPAGQGPARLQDALNEICEQAAEAIQGSYNEDSETAQILVLSDRMAGPDRFPIPSLLAVGAVHQHLLQTKQRPRVGLFLECGDAREVHDMALLLGYGADGICPYVAYEALFKMNADGYILARANQEFSNDELVYGYRKALAKGILKVMSKMGISTLQSYKGAQVFEAVGLSDEIIDRCFTGTTSRIQGADFTALYTDIARLHDLAYPSHTTAVPLLPNPGYFHYRDGGEEHLNSPLSMVALQQAARTNSREAYKMYTKMVDQTNQKCNLRGLLKVKEDPSRAIPIEEVEPAKEIVKRFATGAMSLGSISRETHETLAVAMNTLGGRSNTGEGGEDPVRFGDRRRSSIKQVASGRFGVTSHYLANSDQIQIKMAQGAKPGEGGELPGYKVTNYIASNRHTTPGVGLISPPPHHDIYSIEDLAQLIHDLKNSNPKGEVSVKLVSEVGVGVVAAGVAKAFADHITISGGDGGTGAAAWTGVKGAGLPWELGIAETQQTLVLNDLRSRVRLQTDGQLKTGRDVVVAALLGAEEFGFSTGPLIALGCIMMRKCHLNTCPVGVATQDPLLRKKFSGKPEHVINFFFMMAEEIREYMAKLGYRRFEDMVGQIQHLEVNTDVLHYKSQGLDLKPLLIPAQSLNEKAGIFKQKDQNHGLENALDNELIKRAMPALENKTPVKIELPVTNLNRTVGTMISYEISKRFGAGGLPDDTIHIKLHGHGGQSLGFALAHGVTLEVVGDSNDYVGKGLSGGKIAVYPKKEVIDAGFVAEKNVIVGNVCLYGATEGKAFFRGKAGERFCVRNSGAVAVVEGVGDHGCEYMTGGRTIILGETGRNFAAGMSGGVAYVLDPEKAFPDRCNKGMVNLETVEDPEEAALLKSYIEEHVKFTDSSVGKRVLADWDTSLKHFVKVMPEDYKRAMEEAKGKNTDEVDPDDLSQVALQF